MYKEEKNKLYIDEEAGNTEYEYTSYVFGEFNAKRLNEKFIVYAGIDNTESTNLIVCNDKDKIEMNISLGINREDQELIIRKVSLFLYVTAKRKSIGITKQLKKYIYIIAKRTSGVICGKIWGFYRIYYGLYKNDIELLNQIKARANEVNICSTFYNFAKFLSSEETACFLKEMSCNSPGLCRYILDRLDNAHSFRDYSNLLINAPEFIKKCRYCLHFKDEEIQFILQNNLQPKTRIQYFYVKILAGMDIVHTHKIMFYLIKFQNAELKEWHCYKRYINYKGPYTLKILEQMMITICDGYHIYHYNYMNRCGMNFDEVKGSPIKILQRAIYNHNQEKLLRVKKIFEHPNMILPTPPIKLPEWIENIRLKTTHEMSNAGIECDHCIGSYSNSNDIFVREGNLCGQIDRGSLKVVQCYDHKNRITDRSKNLKLRLEKSLKKLKIDTINA